MSVSGTQCCVTLFVLHCCLLSVLLLWVSHARRGREREVAKLDVDAFNLDRKHGCASETGPASMVHEEWVNRLDGKRILFVGDSITRCAVVLTLAS